MPIDVVKIEKERLDDLEKRLICNSNIMQLKTASQYEAFRLKFLGENIIGYTTGKIVLTGENARKILHEALKPSEPIETDFDLLIGSDEAGKGEWLGPLTIAAVSMEPESSLDFRINGVMDSKEIGLRKIPLIAEWIEENSPAFQVVTISPKRFNVLFEEMKEEKKGLNDILAWGHARAIESVYSKIGERESCRVKLVIDEFDRLKTEDRISRLLGLRPINIIQKHGAEEELAVAAASILARNSRERWIDRESDRLGMDLRKVLPQEAKKMADANTFAKVVYLRRR
jgi:ribonuclease HIII